jgi:hypothetical protein
MDGSAPQPSTASLPNISDYWPDSTTPSADSPRDTPGGLSVPGDGSVSGGAADPPGMDDAAPQGRARRLALVTGVVGAVVLVGVSGVVLLRMATAHDPVPSGALVVPSPEVVEGSPSPPVSIAPPPPAATSAAPSPSLSPSVSLSSSAASPPAGKAPAEAGPAFPAATFVVAGGMRELNISVGRPPTNGIARVGTPDDSSVTPDATLKGTTLTLTTKGNDNDGEAQVDVVLDERIAWTIRTTHGVRRATFAMAGGRVTAFDLRGGANSFDMTLPRQNAAIPLAMSGGVNTWRIRTEGKVPVRLSVGKGVGESKLNGERDENLKPGDTRRADGGDGGGLKIDAVAGIGTLVVEPL